MSRRVPVTLARSEAYAADPARATALWEQGFRPREARLLRPGMTVAFRRTMFGAPLDPAQVASGEVLQVEPLGDGTLQIVHMDGGGDVVTEADEGDEVWARKPVQRLDPPGIGEELEGVLPWLR